MERYEKLVPLVLLSLLVGKSLLFSVDLASMGAIIGLSALQGLNLYLERSKKLQELVVVINKQNEVIEKLAKELETLRSSMTAIKMQTGMRNSK